MNQGKEVLFFKKKNRSDYAPKRYYTHTHDPLHLLSLCLLLAIIRKKRDVDALVA